MSKKYLIATVKKWNINNYHKFCQNKNFKLITNKNDLTLKKIKRLAPQYIFFPHWSWIIPEEIWKNYQCVVFHMTNLPYGRGGSPLQNLILRGHKKTKISAIKVEKELDAGAIYLKTDLSLQGNALEIYQRASEIIFKKMIPYLIKHQPRPKKQSGQVVKFIRRKPEQSKIAEGMTLENLYDFIRMLDAPTYPKAFLEAKNLKLEFSKAELKNNKLTAKVKIYEK